LKNKQTALSRQLQKVAGEWMLNSKKVVNHQGLAVMAWFLTDCCLLSADC
jgi:hypothetical protein